MSKTIQFKPEEVMEIDSKVPEKIKVVSLLKDRIIFIPIFVKPKERSKIIDPHTGESVEREELADRWQVRGEIAFVGEALKQEHPEIKPGAKFFVEDANAVRAIKINGKLYGSTRVSNVYLVYEDL